MIFRINKRALTIYVDIHTTHISCKTKYRIYPKYTDPRQDDIEHRTFRNAANLLLENPVKGKKICHL